MSLSANICKNHTQTSFFCQHGYTVFAAGVALAIMVASVMLASGCTAFALPESGAVSSGMVAMGAFIGCLMITDKNSSCSRTSAQYRVQVLVLIGLGIAAKALVAPKYNGLADAALAFNSAVAGVFAALGWPAYTASASPPAPAAPAAPAKPTTDSQTQQADPP